MDGLMTRAVRLPSAHPDGSTTTHSPETTPIPTHSPGGDNYGALISEGPIAGSFRSLCYSPPFDVVDSDIDFDIKDTFNKIVDPILYE